MIIVCFNYGRFLPKAVESIKAQTLTADQIIVVDGASTDPDTLGGYDRIAELHPEIDIFLLRERGTIGDNRLFAMTRAVGQFVCFLDADDFLDPTYLEKAALALAVSGASVATPYVRAFHDTVSTKPLRVADGAIWPASGLPVPRIFEANCCAVSAVFKRRFWQDHRIGYNQEPELMGVEDWDFWCRFAFHNAKGTVIREPLHGHRVHGTSITDRLGGDVHSKIDLVRKKWKFAARHVEYGDDASRDAGVESSEDMLPIRARKVDVMFVLPFFEDGGMTRLFANLVPYFEGAGLEVLLFSTLLRDLFKNGREVFASSKATLIEARTLCASKEEAAKLLELVFAAHQPRLAINCGSELMYEHLASLRSKHPQTVVVDYLFNPIGHLANRIRFNDLIDFDIVASQEVVAALMDRGASRDRIEVIHHGIPIPSSSETSVVAAGAEDLSSFVFGFFGRMSSEKRPGDAVEMIQRLTRRRLSGADPRLTMVGDGPLTGQIVSAIEQGGLGSNISVRPSIPDAAAFYAEIDALVVCSDVEGLPLVLLEAMAHGRPVIATRVGAIPDVLPTSGAGLLYDPGDIDELERLARQLMSRPASDRAAMGERGRAYVRKHLSIEACAEHHLRVFDRLMKAPARRDASAAAL